MSQIQKKFLKADSVDESKILLLNDGALRARNAADSADVQLMKLDGADKLQLLVLPQVSSDPVAGNDLVRKSHLDSELATAAADVTALEGRVTAIEDDYGVAGGLATLDGSGKIPSSQVPSIAITDVYVVANIAARDALTVEEGDVAKVTDAGAGLPKTYIYDGAAWIEIESGSDVDSVNGQTGAVVLGTNDVAETGATNLYYTPTRQAAIEAYADQAEADAIAAANLYTDGQVTILENEDLTFLKLDGSRSMTGNLEMGGFNIFDTATIYSESVPLSVGSATGLSLDSGTGEVDLLATKIINLATPTDTADAANKGYVDSAVAVEEARALAAEGVIAGDLAQEILDRQSDVDAEETRALAAEALIEADVLALQGLALSFTKEKYVLDATDISNGYIDLASPAVSETIVASVDRLMIHETDDYTVSIVSGSTRLTFVNSLITPGQEKLAVGDVVRVTYGIHPTL